MVAASSAAAPTTLGRLACCVVGSGGAAESILAQIVLNTLRPSRAAIAEEMMANGL